MSSRRFSDRPVVSAHELQCRSFQLTIFLPGMKLPGDRLRSIGRGSRRAAVTGLQQHFHRIMILVGIPEELAGTAASGWPGNRQDGKHCRTRRFSPVLASPCPSPGDAGWSGRRLMQGEHSGLTVRGTEIPHCCRDKHRAEPAKKCSNKRPGAGGEVDRAEKSSVRDLPRVDVIKLRRYQASAARRPRLPCKASLTRTRANGLHITLRYAPIISKTLYYT